MTGPNGTCFVNLAQGGIDVLFLGDSITDGWRDEKDGAPVWKKYREPKPANFGISGDRTQHLLWRLQNGELDGFIEGRSDRSAPTISRGTR